MGQETIERFEAMHAYVNTHVRFIDVSAASQQVSPTIEAHGVSFEWDSVDHIDDESIELNAVLYDKETGYDTFSFPNPDKEDIVLKLGEAFEAAGFPTEHSEIVRVVREFQTNYVPPVKES